MEARVGQAVQLQAYQLAIGSSIRTKPEVEHGQSRDPRVIARLFQGSLGGGWVEQIGERRDAGAALAVARALAALGLGAHRLVLRCPVARKWAQTELVLETPCHRHHAALELAVPRSAVHVAAGKCCGLLAGYTTIERLGPKEPRGWITITIDRDGRDMHVVARSVIVMVVEEGDPCMGRDASLFKRCPHRDLPLGFAEPALGPHNDVDDRVLASAPRRKAV